MGVDETESPCGCCVKDSATLLKETAEDLLSNSGEKKCIYQLQSGNEYRLVLTHMELWLNGKSKS